MGNTDSLPIVSQVKSLVQVIAGDTKGARQTQENFLNTAPVVSQVKSAVQAIEGDTAGAKETQEAFAKSLGQFADGIPVVGHIKGAIEYAVGDTVAGDASMKAANRTVGVIAGGAAGFFVGGPAGAVLGGVAGGAAMDGIITGVDSAVHHEYRPYGEVSSVTNMVNGHFDAGQGFDFAAGIGFDALAGLGEAGEGSLTERFSEHTTGKPVYRVVNEAGAEAALRDNALPPPYAGGEVWITESTEHSRGYMLEDEHRTHLLEVKIDKSSYESIRSNETVAQTEAANHRGKNVWNNERFANDHRPGHGAINLGVKTLAHDDVWGRVDNAMQRLQNVSDFFETQRSSFGNTILLEKGMKKHLGKQFGSGRVIPLKGAIERIATSLENVNYLEAAVDGAAELRNLAEKFDDMAERLHVGQDGITIRQVDVQFIENLQDSLNTVMNRVRESENLGAFNSHIKSIRLIDPYRFKYKARDFVKEITRKNPKSYVTAVASTWGMSRAENETQESRKVEPGAHEYALANSTQTYSAPSKIVINGRKIHSKGPLMDAPLTVGALPVKSLKVTGKAQAVGGSANPWHIVMRLNRRGLPEENFHDIDISGPIEEAEKDISFFDSAVGLQNLGIGGTIDFFCIAGGSEEQELHVTDLTCKVAFGDVQHKIAHSNDDNYSILTFAPERGAQMQNSIHTIVPLFEEFIPLGTSTILGVTASFRAKDQGWGNMKGNVYLRIWKNSEDFVDFNLSGTISHSWTEYSWSSEDSIKEKIAIGARAQLMCRVGGGGGHELYVENMVLDFKIGRPQHDMKNSFSFVRDTARNLTNSNDLLPLFDDKLEISDDLSHIRIRFHAKDQGSGNLKGRLAMRIIKPSGDMENVFLHSGLLGHNWMAYEYNSSKIAQERIEKGDTIQFMCIVGGGGGHALYVENFDAVFTLRNTTKTFAPAQSVHNKTSIHNLVPLYSHKIPCGINALSKAKITFRGKDQGWGNIKGVIFMRIWSNGLKDVVRDIHVASLGHEWNSYTFISPPDLSSMVPPGSVLQFMVRVGGGGGHEAYIEDFVAELTFSDAPRTEVISYHHGNSAPSIACGAKLKSLIASGNGSPITVKVVKNDKSIRSTFSLSSQLDAKFLKSKIAIGDTLKFDGNDFQVTASFLPLEIPDHENVVVQYSNRLDYWDFIHGKDATNILDDEQGLELKMKLRVLTVSCNWTDDNPEEESTGKLFLVLKDNAGKEKGRYDVFGKVTHDWVHKMRVFNSDSELIKSAEVSDKLLMMREVGNNGELHIDNLDMYLMLSE